jgi:hypothetical protein
MFDKDENKENLWIASDLFDGTMCSPSDDYTQVDILQTEKTFLAVITALYLTTLQLLVCMFKNTYRTC